MTPFGEYSGLISQGGAGATLLVSAPGVGRKVVMGVGE